MKWIKGTHDIVVQSIGFHLLKADQLAHDCEEGLLLLVFVGTLILLRFEEIVQENKMFNASRGRCATSFVTSACI